MATRTVATKLELDGEKEFRSAITGINSDLRVLNSQMKLTSEQYADTAGSTKALTAQNEILNQKMDAQRQKIETLRAALKSAEGSTNSNERQVNGWKDSLNKAETELLQMQHQLEKNDVAIKANETSNKGLQQSMDGVTAKGTGLGTALDSLTTKFGVSLPNGMKNALDGFAKIGVKTLAVVGTFAAAALAIEKVEKALISLTDKQAAAADTIMTMSLQTGLATDTLQELRYAAELIDVPVETLQSSMAKMIRSMNTARGGTGDAAEAFAKLGVSITDSNGNLLGSEEVFNKTVDALHNMSNATERDAASMAIFGKSAQDLNPLIVQGSDTLSKYRKEAEDTGYVLSDDMLASLGAVDDAHQRLINTQEEARNKLAIQFAPALTRFYDSMSSGWDKMSTDIEKSGVVDAFASLLKCVLALSPAFEGLGDILGSLRPVFETLAATLEGVAKLMALIADTADVIVGTLTLNSDLLNTGLGLYGNSHYQQATNSTDAYSTNVWDAEKHAWVGNGSASYNAAGDASFPGGYTWVGENGPELAYLPQGTTIKTAQESRMMGGDTFNITIPAKDIKEFNDIVRIAQDARRMQRMGASN